MSDPIGSLYEQIKSTDERLIKRWVQALKKRIADFAKAASTASPYLDKPSYQRDFQRGRFWIKPRKEGFVIYGISPNAARVRGFGAPVNEWKQTDKTFAIFGEDGWRKIRKVQLTSKSTGLEMAKAYYFGQPVQVKGYFGLKKGKATLAYGKTDEGQAMPVYAKESFADWLMDRHRDEIDRLVLEVGQEVLAKHLERSGT